MELAIGKRNYTLVEAIYRGRNIEILGKYRKFDAACRPQMTFLCEERVNFERCVWTHQGCECVLNDANELKPAIL